LITLRGGRGWSEILNGATDATRLARSLTSQDNINTGGAMLNGGHRDARVQVIPECAAAQGNFAASGHSSALSSRVDRNAPSRLLYPRIPQSCRSNPGTYLSGSSSRKMSGLDESLISGLTLGSCKSQWTVPAIPGGHSTKHGTLLPSLCRHSSRWCPSSYTYRCHRFVLNRHGPFSRS
jgi:hypothetical protein